MTEQTSVRVELAERSYEIVIASEALAQFAASLDRWRDGQGPGSAFVVTDRNVAASHGQTVTDSLEQAGWRVATAVLEPGETSKSLATISSLYDQLVGMRADRSTVLVAVGGGVVGDAGGFAAATYLRGIPFVQVPTTLLAQVDSSVGGKTGVNHPQGKNLIGAFYQPLGVFIDTAVLATLPERDYKSGLAEVVKYGVILDEEFFAYLETNAAGLNARAADVLRHVIRRSCELKAEVVSADERETTGLRAILNYGHTFCHAFEALCGYGELLHGEAVAIGMLYASKLAEHLGRVPPDVSQRQQDLLETLGLPTSLPDPSRLSTDSLLETMRLDKKTQAGRLRFVLPSKIGAVEVVGDVEESVVREVLGEAGHGG